MIFSEIYSVYFNAVAAIIRKSLEGEIDEPTIYQIIDEFAFSESALTILPAIKNEEWLVMNAAFETPLNTAPQMPLTILQKRWLKALLADPRVALFDISVAGLEDVEPLFQMSDFFFFDRYADGDPYSDLAYISHFQTILRAIREKRVVNIRYHNRHNMLIEGCYFPYKLEYSAKDDKFRLKTRTRDIAIDINLARIEVCSLGAMASEMESLAHFSQKEGCFTFLLDDNRNALDRVMLHFSDCRKQTQRMAEHQYQVEVWYRPQDEMEMIIRILSFGPMITVTAPDNFIALLKKRLGMQIEVNRKSCEH